MMRDIPGYEGRYAASEDGAVWSLLYLGKGRKQPMRPYINSGGYLRVNLSKDGKMRHEYVHRLIAKTFIPNPGRLPEVNHINRNKSDNRVCNLEWCSTKENANAALQTGKYARSRVVIARSRTTGEERFFLHIKTAARELFGKGYALSYLIKTRGDHFCLGGWDITVKKEERMRPK